MRDLYNASIWAPDAIPADEWKYRNLKRVMFPMVDILFFFGGISAAVYGVPAISEFFPDATVDFFSYTLSIVAFVCLLGVSFPRLWPMEILGKAILFGLMFGYCASLFALTAVGEESRGFVLTVGLVSLCPILWRLSLLGSEWQLRRVTEKHLKAALKESQGD